ncbi:hypothetical protein OF83DRAFT_1169687 [Amylostereum chailletii]|nr:hypothetical protein OF83DRAFT_1169687 [Amylostereum chailletii]
MQIIVTVLLNPDKAVLVMSPLKHLHNSMAEEIATTTGDLWTDTETGKYRIVLLLTSSEQRGTIDGHATRFSRLIKGSARFRGSLVRNIVDEAHLICLWGQPSIIKPSFRGAWSRIRSHLAAGTPIPLLTATAPRHIVDSWNRSVHLGSDFAVIKTIPNRPDQTFAVCPIYGDLKDFCNFRKAIVQ